MLPADPKKTVGQCQEKHGRNNGERNATSAHWQKKLFYCIVRCQSLFIVMERIYTSETVWLTSEDAVATTHPRARNFERTTPSPENATIRLNARAQCRIEQRKCRRSREETG